MSQTAFLFMAEMQDAEQLTQRTASIAQHRESLAICWPEWEGPRVEDSIHGTLLRA